MTIKMNPLREKVIATLKGATAPMTLAEISAAVGEEVKTGSTNALVKAGVIVIAGERLIVCPVCGGKHKVKEYAFGSMPAAK